MNLPSLDNPDLAYETGVHLGDGSLSKYRYVVSGNRRNETEYYVGVLAPLVEKLFNVRPAIAFENNSVYLRVYSKELVLFKHEVLGLPIGRKLGLHIPNSATRTPEGTSNIISGFYDTDGCVKIRHDASGDYPRISLGQKQYDLVEQTKVYLLQFGITSTMYRNDYFDRRGGILETRWFLDINGFKNFDLFRDLIGTRNPYVKKRMEAVEDLR
jgi:hypothetical protein